ncbi:MAG: ATP-binding protein [Candidatus Schekmanbacteria bacterium]|nr:MAG: ATP-binding protein [Candidatus Schekmanbacteria bacterium]
MISRVESSTTIGIEAYTVHVEIDAAPGIPSYNTVGLPDTAVRESRERVKAAITNSGYKFPVKKITVNLAPANMRKEGPIFDLPIAAGILSACIPQARITRFGYVIAGELSLDGSIRPIKGVLPMALAAKKNGKRGIIIPFQNRLEASLVDGIEVIPVNHLTEAVNFLNGNIEISPYKSNIKELFQRQNGIEPDFCDVKGQEHAKRALEIAAAGSHNILMIGSPGAGKTMLARRLPSILPEMTFEEAIECTRIHSVLGNINSNFPIINKRPFRSPHHSISDAGLIGGGTSPMPGEASIAHNGVLFLDELPEFRRNVIESLRQPLEDGKITISRATGSLTFPSKFMLVAALNPCPCGYRFDENKQCICTPNQIQRYLAKISGPLLDRIDIHIEVPSLKFREMANDTRGESSETIRKRVNKARQIQLKRYEGSGIFFNSRMTQKHIREFCRINKESKDLLEAAIRKFSLSARAYDRILKIARTIADLDEAEKIKTEHIAEAIQYRSLDRNEYY